MNHALKVARFLCYRLPASIESRILNSKEIKKEFGITYEQVIKFGEKVCVKRDSLFAAIRKAIRDNKEIKILDIDGEKELYVKVDSDSISIKGDLGNKQQIDGRFDELLVLSPHRETRVKAFLLLLELIGPAAPDLSPLRRAVDERDLTDAEVGVLLDERSRGVISQQQRITPAVETNQVVLEDLIPSSLRYYEYFCGPNPGELTPEAYIKEKLPEYRKELLARDFARGLDICLIGALRDDLSPSLWVAEISNDVLWEGLTEINPDDNPFSLVAALDIALYRQSDERFQKFAEESVKKLTGKDFIRFDGIDTYELLPVLSELALNRINGLEGCVLRAPFWKRMCAWMQAALINKHTSSIELNMDGVREWSNKMTTLRGAIAKLSDFRKEPMFQAYMMSSETLHYEIIGRLQAIRHRHEKDGRIFPNSELLNTAIEEIENKASPISIYLPGPLEGHLEVSELPDRKIPEADISRIFEMLRDEPNGVVWAQLAYMSQCFNMGPEIMAEAHDTLIRLEHCSADSEDINREMHLLNHAALVAISHRDKRLSKAIGERLVTIATNVQVTEEISGLVNTLMLASSVFKEDGEWESWLRETLARIALNMPTGRLSHDYLMYVKELKMVIPLNHCVISRAEAIASAAS